MVEKGLETMDDFCRGKIIGKFIFLLKNKFGNFVLNKAYKYMTSETKKEFEFYLINNINIFNNKEKYIIKKFLTRNM